MTSPLHVAMVTHSLNHNNIGRVYPFLRAFVGSPDVRCTLVGWDEGGPLFPLLAGLPWPVIRLRGPLGGGAAVRELADALRGCDVVQCFKSRAHLPTALAAARQLGQGLALDLDDWELGLYLEGVAGWPGWRRLLWGGPITARIASELELERLARTAPQAITVNSRALQGHFGGEIVYTAADAEQFDPARADGQAFRREHGLAPSDKVIGFLGTPHPHKGVDELLAAFRALRAGDPAVRLLVVGVPAHNPYHGRLLAEPGAVVVGYAAADAYPSAYAACDVLAVPQRAVTEGIMQTPAKLVLAMAAGRAIVATRVGDMPEILGQAGVLVPPENAKALEQALRELLADDVRRTELGRAARERFLARLTLAQLGERMTAIYRGIAGGGAVE